MFWFLALTKSRGVREKPNDIGIVIGNYNPLFHQRFPVKRNEGKNRVFDANKGQERPIKARIVQNDRYCN